MTPQEMILLLQIDPDPPPWEGEIKEIQATVIANRQPVRVRVVEVYEYWGRPMASVQALEGQPFLETNAWFHTWCSATRSLQISFLQDVRLMY